MKKFLLAISLIATTLSFGQPPLNIVIPAPSQLKIKDGIFTINSDTKIAFAAAGLEKSASFLNNYLQQYYGFQLPVTMKKVKADNVIYLDYDNQRTSVPGYYSINIDNNALSQTR